MSKLIAVTIIFISFFTVFLVPYVSQAAGIIPPPTGTCPLEDRQGNCIGEPNYRICDFLVLFVNITRWILGISGALTLFFVANGGIGFVLSAGNREKVTAARKGLTSAIFGFIIVLAAWQLINLVIFLLTPASSRGTTAKIFTTPWSTLGQNICS